MIDFMIPFASL